MRGAARLARAIIPFNDEPARFVAKALSPARVREVLVEDEARQATVIVPDDQLSLAIGREGQNARLAARLTGWRIDIRSETEFAAEEAEHGYEEEEVQGRCAAILSSGRRCPNAALPGSRYCGLEAHQALAAIDSDRVTDLTAGEQGAEPPAPEPAAADQVPAAEVTAEDVAAESSDEGGGGPDAEPGGVEASGAEAHEEPVGEQGEPVAAGERGGWQDPVSASAAGAEQGPGGPAGEPSQ
jgi:N utilization substance protein A